MSRVECAIPSFLKPEALLPLTPAKKKKKDLSDISDAKEQFNRIIMYKRLKQLKDNEIR